MADHPRKSIVESMVNFTGGVHLRTGANKWVSWLFIVAGAFFLWGGIEPVLVGQELDKGLLGLSVLSFLLGARFWRSNRRQTAPAD